MAEQAVNRNVFIYMIISSAILALVFVVLDSILLQRSYQYFGGGALNRPYALTDWPSYGRFIAISVLHATLFWGSLAVLLVKFLLPGIRYSVYQAIVLSFFMFMMVQCVYDIFKWQIFTYFSTAFNLDVLKQLTSGATLNMFAWVSVEQFILLPVSALLIAAIFVAARKIQRNENIFFRAPAHLKWSLPLSWMGIFLVHFPAITNESPRYGLNQQIPYMVTQKVLEYLTDFDGDGFGPLTTPSDPDNFNSSIHPYALDIHGNGIDEDGLSGDLPSLPDAKSPLVINSSAEHKNVILIVVETFRTDVFDMAIDGEKVMPFLNDVGHSNAYTLDAYSNYGITGSAIQTLLAGNLHYNASSRFLFDVFKDAGYKTYVVSAQDESWGDTRKMLRMGEVSSYYDATQMQWNESKLTTWQKLNRNGLTLGWQQVNNKVREYLAKNGNDRFFMYLNYQELHYPYYTDDIPKKFIKEGRKDASFFVPQNREAIIKQYANAANYLDKGFQDLFVYLKEKKILENTVIVIVGDHPDSFYENGLLGHAWSLNEHQRKTPLIVINGKGRYTTPIGQDEIAEIMINTLNNTAQPDLNFSGDINKRLLLIQGGLEQPIRIGWAGNSGLFTFDFKTMRAQESEDKAWIPIEGLSNATQNSNDALIHRWEAEKYLAHQKINGAGP